MFTRRRFLRLGLGIGVGVGAGALVFGGTGLVLLRAGPPGPGRQVLSPDEVAFLDALKEAWLPPGNDLGLDAAALDVASSFDAHLAALPGRERRVMRGLLAVFDQWPRVSLSSSGRFSALSLEDRVRSLEAWEHSKSQARHGVMGLLRVLVGLHIFSHPEALAAVGHRDGCGAHS